MCIAPCNMPTVGLVPCRYCWQCRANRVNDLVGRCIAEQHYSEQTFAVTLTYAGDVPAASTLIYADIQKFIKRLRKTPKGEPKRHVRYIVAGEYGKKKGRAHWHIILFINGNPLPVSGIMQDRKPNEIYIARRKTDRINWTGWKHGFSLFQVPDPGGFAYVLKYVLKDLQADVHRTHLAMSKKPPLGYQYFVDLAKQHVDQGLAPQHANYKFRGLKDNRGLPRGFQLRGRMLQIYLDAYRALWSISRGGEYPISDILLEREDYLLSDNETFDRDNWKTHLAAKPLPPLSNDEIEENHQAFLLTPKRYLICPYRDIMVTEYNDLTVIVQIEDKDPWHAENLQEAESQIKRLGFDVTLVNFEFSKE